MFIGKGVSLLPPSEESKASVFGVTESNETVTDEKIMPELSIMQRAILFWYLCQKI